MGKTKVIKGDYVIKTSDLSAFIALMAHNDYAVSSIPINEEKVRVIVIEASFYFNDEVE